MAVNLGTTPIANIYIGNTQIQNVYLGNALVYSAINAFIFTINTTKTSTGSTTATQFKLPLVSSFNGITSIVDWGDGSTDTVTAFNAAAVTHTYAASGTYTVKISGALRAWQFNNTGDRLKIISITNWGIFDISIDNGFNGCGELTTVSATDRPTVSSASLFGYFNGCVKLTSLNLLGLNTQNITNLSFFVSNCTLMTSLIATDWNVEKVTTTEFFASSSPLLSVNTSNWNTAELLTVRSMFFRAFSINNSFANFNIRKVTNFTNFLNGVTISTANYDATLISFNAQPPLSGRVFDFGNSKFTLGSTAAAARASLINNFGATITDGGGI